MPLSDEELEILRGIEAQLSESDPELVEQVAHTTIYSHAGRNIRFALLCSVAGLVVIVTQFTNSTVAAALGFIVMLGSLLVVADNAKKLGKASLAELIGIRSNFPRGGLSEALKERFGLQRPNDPKA